MSRMPISTVIIPAAGLGTRLLPATKVTAKELLPVYDRVVLDFAIEEAVGLGADRIVVVVSTAKIAIQAYLARSGLEATLRHDPAGSMGGRPAPEIVFVFQDRPLGLGHAVLSCAHVTLPGPFAVLLPDDIIMGPNCLAEMAQHYTDGHMIAAMQVKSEETSSYGIFQLGGLPRENCLPVTGMVEKPAPGLAPSSFAAVGRYILDPMIFAVLAHTPSGKGGEIQLTDAITISGRATPLTAFRFRGTRHDCGNHDGLLLASMARKAAVVQERSPAAVGAVASAAAITPEGAVAAASAGRADRPAFDLGSLQGLQLSRNM